MRRETEKHRRYTMTLFYLRQARGIYLLDITFNNLTELEKDRLRAQGKHWARKHKGDLVK